MFLAQGAGLTLMSQGWFSEHCSDFIGSIGEVTAKAVDLKSLDCLSCAVAYLGEHGAMPLEPTLIL